MKQLITNASDSRHVKLQSSTKNIETVLLSGISIPIRNEFSERLVHLSFNGNGREFVMQSRDHHQVRLTVPSRRT